MGGIDRCRGGTAGRGIGPTTSLLVGNVERNARLVIRKQAQAVRKNLLDRAWRSRLVIAAEFSRICATDRLPPEGEAFAIEASGPERTAVARRLDLVAIEALRARGAIGRRGAEGVLAVEGSLSAEVVQRCVVTLEPIVVELETGFTRLFSAAVAEQAVEVDIDPAAELVEPLDNGLIDLGEIAVEELSLALDPYPRAVEGLPADLVDDRTPDPGSTPFAALAASLRRH